MVEPPPERRYARVPPDAKGSRLDLFLVEYFPQYSRRKIQEVIRRGEVRIDGRRAKPGTLLQGEERLELPILSRAVADVDKSVRRRENLRLKSHAPREVEVLHRDDALLVVSKPPGVPVHGGAGLGATKTLVDLLKDDVLQGFGLVHRIDRDTSGIVILVRGEEARARIGALFAKDDGGIEKTYEALVDGVPDPEQGEIDLPLAPPGHRTRARVDEEAGRPARTHYEVVEAFTEAARVRLGLLTGRTHQIRLHLAAIGHPLIVDPAYGERGGWKLQDPRGLLDARLRRTPLHAARLTLPHPTTGELVTYEAPLPPDMKYALEVLRVRAGGRRKRSEDPDTEGPGTTAS